MQINVISINNESIHYIDRVQKYWKINDNRITI